MVLQKLGDVWNWCFWVFFLHMGILKVLVLRTSGDFCCSFDMFWLYFKAYLWGIRSICSGLNIVVCFLCFFFLGGGGVFVLLFGACFKFITLFLLGGVLEYLWPHLKGRLRFFCLFMAVLNKYKHIDLREKAGCILVWVLVLDRFLRTRWQSFCYLLMSRPTCLQNKNIICICKWKM